MIKVSKVEENYDRCQSCWKNERDDNLEIWHISIGLNSSHTSSFRLCPDCLKEMNRQVKEWEVEG